MTEEQTLTIRTERTPNPNSLKYHMGMTLIPGGQANFPNVDSAKRSPLATRIFAIDGVSSVFIGSDFVTVSREKDESEGGLSWVDLNSQLAPVLEAFLDSGDPVLTGKAPKEFAEIGAETADPQVVATIKEILDTKVRPAVAQDGGDIIYRGFEGGVVFLEMHGSCAGCPSSTITLHQGIENMLKNHLAEHVKEVRAL